MIFLWNGWFLCLERRLVTMNMQSSLFFSLRVWRTQTPSLLMFPTFFKWWQIVDWSVLKSSAKSQVFLCGLHYTTSFKASLSRSDKYQGSSLNDVSQERKIWKPISDLLVSNDILTINTINFSSVFVIKFLQHFEYALSVLLFLGYEIIDEMITFIVHFNFSSENWN